LATDKDSNENQALTYMIISGNEDAQFEMNSGNGKISLVGILDRESQDSYVLQVMATDSGSTNIMYVNAWFSLLSLSVANTLTTGEYFGSFSFSAAL
jgi:hypothetical protein